MIELTREQVTELLDTACPKCKEAWPVKWSDRDKSWFHQRHNNGSISTVICLATNLREHYTKVLNG